MKKLLVSLLVLLMVTASTTEIVMRNLSHRPDNAGHSNIVSILNRY